jgi:hypothetical protein
MRWSLLAAALLVAGSALAAGGEKPVERTYAVTPPAPAGQTAAETAAKSAGCVTCHEKTDAPTMHTDLGVQLGCVDCHGGDHTVARAASDRPGSPGYMATLERAHVLPKYPGLWRWPSSANPERSYTLLNHEAPEYIRFVNPGDYRIVREACGACHQKQIQAAERSIMATSAMLWGGAAYNNGILPFKRYLLGEAYTRDGAPAVLESPIPVTDKMKARGALAKLYPLPAWEVLPQGRGFAGTGDERVAAVGDVFRVFERGGRNIVTQFPEVGLPNALGQLQRLEEPGRPDFRQSNRGPGTGNRIAVPVINITKTRLNDPHTWFLGTNDQAGDYRSSGCSACHVVYANDRDPVHSGPYAPFGNRGQTQTVDPAVNGTHFPEMAGERGHPLRHAFTSAIPSSQCMICHMHQPNVFVNTYYGTIMWDYESDAPLMWPKKEIDPRTRDLGQPLRERARHDGLDGETYQEWQRAREILDRNPERAAERGLWGDRDFLEAVWTDVNPRTRHTRFADYHGHGWNFRYVFSRDRKGNLLDGEGRIVPNDDPDKLDKAVHMMSIHAEVGMHCVDCHFQQDGHGNGLIHGEVAAAVQIQCKDCHGTALAYPTLRTSGPAAAPKGEDLSLLRNPDGKLRFEWIGDRLIQRSVVTPGLEWEVSLTKDGVTPGHRDYSAESARAKLMAELSGPGDKKQEWGPGVPAALLAHKDEEMACFSCHFSWTTSCAGCHLPIEANWKTERHHYEGGFTRNWASYNPQITRDDMYQLGRHGSVKGGIIAPIRSSSALILSSTDMSRQRIYVQQPPVAASGHSSQAFAPHFPHTVRVEETRRCEDCHVSERDDNNAIMAQLLLQGTNFVNFLGHYAYVGAEAGIQATRVTEWDEPQAVVGSYLHRYAYPARFAAMAARDRRIAGDPRNDVATHATAGPARCVQLRGEYLYVAETGGVQVYDVASIANKGVSQRIITAPFSPLGHDAFLEGTDVTCVALPTNQPVMPSKYDFYEARFPGVMTQENEETRMHPLYEYAFATDSVEGLIAFHVETFQDGEPRNNFVERAVTWNPGGLLDGARHLTIAGEYVYVAADAGVVVVNIDDPVKPRHVATIPFRDARATAVQFRYLFVTDAEGFHTVDVTWPERPEKVEGASVPLADAQRIYVARTYAYVAAKAQGLAILDVERPRAPKVYRMETLGGRMTDVRDVVVASTNASLFAYVADGAGGLKVLQLTSPDSQPNFYGFSPEPRPELIGWEPTRSPALAISKGLDRDRGVDETGNQIAIFGRLGSRPFTDAEMRRLFYDRDGYLWTVTNELRMKDFVR